MSMPMTKRTCSHCGTFCWANPTVKKDRDPYRCTFCGHPCVAMHGTAKRAYQDDIRDRQTVKAEARRRANG